MRQNQLATLGGVGIQVIEVGEVRGILEGRGRMRSHARSPIPPERSLRRGKQTPKSGKTKTSVLQQNRPAWSVTLASRPSVGGVSAVSCRSGAGVACGWIQLASGQGFVAIEARSPGCERAYGIRDVGKGLVKRGQAVVVDGLAERLRRRVGPSSADVRCGRCRRDFWVAAALTAMHPTRRTASAARGSISKSRTKSSLLARFGIPRTSS